MALLIAQSVLVYSRHVIGEFIAPNGSLSQLVVPYRGAAVGSLPGVLVFTDYAPQGYAWPPEIAEKYRPFTQTIGNVSIDDEMRDAKPAPADVGIVGSPIALLVTNKWLVDGSGFVRSTTATGTGVEVEERNDIKVLKIQAGEAAFEFFSPVFFTIRELRTDIGSYKHAVSGPANVLVPAAILLSRMGIPAIYTNKLYVGVQGGALAIAKMQSLVGDLTISYLVKLLDKREQEMLKKVMAYFLYKYKGDILFLIPGLKDGHLKPSIVLSKA